MSEPDGLVSSDSGRSIDSRKSGLHEMFGGADSDVVPGECSVPGGNKQGKGVKKNEEIFDRIGGFDVVLDGW